VILHKLLPGGQTVEEEFKSWFYHEYKK
jgi:hypothetical protein